VQRSPSVPSSLSRGFQTAIDVGSTKVCVVVCRSSARGLDIVGHGVSACLPDLDSTTRAIQDAVAQAERRFQLRISAVYASLAQARGQVFGLGADAARCIAEREAQLTCLERAGLSVVDFVPSSIASAESALSLEERRTGVALLDVGARTADLAVYEQGAVAKTEVIALGGATLTAALATRFEVSLSEAEFLKRNAGIAVSSSLDPNELVAVPNCSHGEGKPIRRRDFARVIESRLEPLWRRVSRTLDSRALPGGVVLSGGATLLDGFTALAELRLARPVRLAAPFGVEGLPGQLLSPCFATGVGLALYAARHADVLGQRSATWGRRTLATA
jgi:cell division ATPase FtsA